MMNSALSCGRPLAAARDIKDGELNIASHWSRMRHICRIGFADSDLIFFRAFKSNMMYLNTFLRRKGGLKLIQKALSWDEYFLNFLTLQAF